MTSPIVSVIVRGSPVSKGRPRFGSGRTYTPQSTIDAEQAIQWAIKQKYPGLLMNEESSYAVYLYFYTKTARRVDLDNLVKLVLDAMNKMVFKDDSQVTEITARLIRKDKNPRTEITAAAID